MEKLALFGGKKIRIKPFVSQAIIGKEERDRVKDVLDSGMLSGFVAQVGDNFLGGKQVKELEGLIKNYFSVEFAVTVNSATAGLHTAVSACGIGPGDEVIVTPYTMSASATAIIMQNAKPIFADIDEEIFCMNPSEIEKNITSHTRAIIVVHLFGYPAEMDAIIKIAKKYNLYVIEDCAQAPGAIYQGKLVGTIGDIGVFSLNQHKTITSGEGGFAITNNKKLALRMQLVRNHGEAVVAKMGDEDNYDIVGCNYRMTELEAAVGIGQFKRLNKLNTHRISLVEYLVKRLSKFKGLVLPQKDSNKHVYFVLPIKFKENIIGISRDIFVKALLAEGIPIGAGYVKPIYLEPIYQEKINDNKQGYFSACSTQESEANYLKGICPVAERMYENELMLTGVCRYPHSKEDMDDVVKAFEKVFANITELKKAKA